MNYVDLEYIKDLKLLFAAQNSLVRANLTASFLSDDIYVLLCS